MPETEQHSTNITNGELARAVNLIRTDIRDLKTDVSNKPSANDIKYLESRIIDLEEWQKWAIRLGIPALMAIVYNTLTNVDKVL